jgi:glyoxylase-like metal-dependent hydrolase (beta-lactamase superfamily II)
MTDETLYFRQLLAGRDFATAHPVAPQMANFSYLIGDRSAKKAVVVDPAWDVRSLVGTAKGNGMEVEGVLVTHCHPDHIGGDLFGVPVEGLAELLELESPAVHVHEAEAERLKSVTGAADSDVNAHRDGDRLAVGDVEIEMRHTPGHSPGSLCFLVRNRLVSGDTLFVQGCGRIDLPGSEPEEMYHSLTARLADLGDDVLLYPGHDYGSQPWSTLGEERRTNSYLRIPTLDDWLRLMGR